MPQPDLFRSPFHAIVVFRNCQVSDVEPFQNQDAMRKSIVLRMRRDNAGTKAIAYAELCHWTGEKVISLERIYADDKEVTFK